MTATEPVIRFAAPSGRARSTNVNEQVANTLKRNPDDWGIIEEVEINDLDDAAKKKIKAKASNRSSLIKNGRLKPFSPAGQFNAVSRTEARVPAEEEGHDPADLVVRVYAMYQSAFVAPEPEAVEANGSADA